jgi:hypothetical protein
VQLPNHDGLGCKETCTEKFAQKQKVVMSVLTGCRTLPDEAEKVAKAFSRTTRPCAVMGIPVHELLPATNAADHSFVEAKSVLADDHPGHPETVANRS